MNESRPNSKIICGDANFTALTFSNVGRVIHVI